MPLEVKCRCGRRVPVPAGAGRKVTCPDCGAELTTPPPLPPARAEDGPVDLVLRFAGQGGEAARRHGQAVVNSGIENPVCLQVLFDDPPRFDPADLTGRLRRYHPSMAEGKFEVERAGEDSQSAYGLAGWGNHVVRVLAFDAPIPASVLERCVDPAHYKPAMKKRARANRAHALLYYAGREEDTLGQYVALAAVAGCLAHLQASVVTNETAHASLPAMVFAPGQAEGDQLEVIKAFPLLHLFCGFVKYHVEGEGGVWMRTYGAHEFGLPDFAFHADDHDEGEEVFEVIGNILDYLRESGAVMDDGHTMQVGPDSYMRLRAPKKREGFLESDGEMLVMERIRKSEINPGRPRRGRDD